MFRDLLQERTSSFCKLSVEQVDQLEQHYTLLLRWNRVINLTRIESLADAVERHYVESLFLGTKLPSGSLTIADVGSGGGFPGLPVAVLRPDCVVTLIESHQRKAVFLKEASRSMPNVRVLAMRAEDVAEKFDWVVSRAVSWKDLQRFARPLSSNLAWLGSESPAGAEIFALPSGKTSVFHVKQ